MKKFHMIIGILGVLILAGGIYAVNSGAFDDIVSSFASNDTNSTNNTNSKVNHNDNMNKSTILNNSNHIASKVNHVSIKKISNNSEQQIDIERLVNDILSNTNKTIYHEIGKDGKHYLTEMLHIPSSSSELHAYAKHVNIPVPDTGLDVIIHISLSPYSGGIVDKYWWKTSNETVNFIYSYEMTDEEKIAMWESEIAWQEYHGWFREYGWMENVTNIECPNIDKPLILTPVMEGGEDNFIINSTHPNIDKPSFDVDSNKHLLDNSDNTNNKTFDGVIIN